MTGTPAPSNKPSPYVFTCIGNKVLIGGLIVTIAAIGGIKFFSLSTGMNISTYSTSIALLTVLLYIATIFYCVAIFMMISVKLWKHESANVIMIMCNMPNGGGDIDKAHY